MSFWDRALGGTPQQEPPRAVPARTQRAWWQDPEPVQEPRSALEYQMPYNGPTGGPGLPEAQYIAGLKKKSAQELSPEEMETIAEYELRTKPNQQNRCPQCGGSDYIPSGTRGVGATATCDRCFTCGYSSRGMSPDMQPSTGGGAGGAVQHTRQIDAGGAAGSMYLSGRGVPASYMPKGV